MKRFQIYRIDQIPSYIRCVAMHSSFLLQALSRCRADFAAFLRCSLLRIHNLYALTETHKSGLTEANRGWMLRKSSIDWKQLAARYWDLRGCGNERYVDATRDQGILTRLMREYGLNFDRKDKYCENSGASNMASSRKFGRLTVAKTFTDHQSVLAEFV